MPIFTSRGCPYGCAYCHNIFGKRTRFRSAENVLREMEILTGKYAAGEIEVLDDIFNFDLVRAKRICDGILERGIKVRLSFPNALRPDNMDEELIKKLKKAGASLISFAIESASPEVQKRMGRNQNLAKTADIVRLTAGQGILTAGYFMMGFPDETKQEMLDTIRLAKSLPLHLAAFSYVTPRPDTQLERMMKARGLDLAGVDLHHYHRFSVNMSAATDAELKKMWSKAYLGFYLRPSQIWRIWKVLPGGTDLLRLAVIILKRCLPDFGG